MKLPVFSNHGCRLNAYETQVMRKLSSEAGVQNTVVINTCSVTQEAVRKARKDIRKQREQHPEARLIVTGCAAQIDPESFAAMDEVDMVIGNTEKMQPETWARLSQDAPIEPTQKVRVNDIMSVRETAGHLIDGFGTRARAYVQIQNGCDHRCTFCIIPFGRGNARSVPAGVIVDQIKRLVDNGYREVVLTGVDITSWGKDLPGKPGFGNLVLRILRLVQDLPRLRISSIDSIEVDQELMEAIAVETRLMPHLHLSLQHGDDLILKRMKRRHLRDDAIRLTQEVRKLRPEITFGADLIAGFPTENRAQFENSRTLIEECGLTWLHIFPYSPRPGTPAARMPQVAREIVRKRAAILRKDSQRAQNAHLTTQVGKRHLVLMESPQMGRTEQFTPVCLDQASLTGQIIQTQISGQNGAQLLGACVP